MPKRTNEFQQLVNLIEYQLAPKGAKVTQSKMLKDILGEEREVDIVIEHQIGVHPVVIGIECISTERPAGKPWVNSMFGKHEDLPINQTILVSKSGFYKSAEKLANKRNMRTITLEKALQADWLNSINFVSFLLPYISGINVIFKDGSKPPDLDYIKEATLYRPDDMAVGTIYEAAQRRVNDPAFIKAVREHAFEDSGTVIDLTLPLVKGAYLLDENNQRQFVYALEIEAKCKKEFLSLTPTHTTYDSVQVAFGSGNSMGKKVLFTATKQSSGEVTVGVHIENPKKPKSKKQ